MRTLRVVTTAIVSVLLLTACGGGDDGGALSEEEQRFATAFARDLADADDGLAVDSEGGQCIGEAIMRELGTDPFHEAKVTPQDLSGSESPGELLGKGRVSDDQADAIADAWNDCVDLPAVFASEGADQFGLDEAGVRCFEDQLRSSGVLDGYLTVSFTSDDPADGREVLNEIVGLVQECTASDDGQGGVLVDSIAASLAQDGTLDVEQATCVAQHLVDDLGADKLSAGVDEEDPAVQEEFAQALLDAADDCGVDPSLLQD